MHCSLLKFWNWTHLSRKGIVKRAPSGRFKGFWTPIPFSSKCKWVFRCQWWQLWKSPHARKGDTRRVAFSRVGWFSRAVAFRSLYYPLRKYGGLLVVYSRIKISFLCEQVLNTCREATSRVKRLLVIAVSLSVPFRWDLFRFVPPHQGLTILTWLHWSAVTVCIFPASIYRHVGAVGVLPDLLVASPDLNKGQLRAVLVLSASPFTGCYAIVRSGISFHGES